MDAVVYFRIQDATISITNVSDASASTKLLAQTTLRNMIGTRSLSEILTDREGISAQMQVGLVRSRDPSLRGHPYMINKTMLKLVPEQYDKILSFYSL